MQIERPGLGIRCDRYPLELHPSVNVRMYKLNLLCVYQVCTSSIVRPGPDLLRRAPDCGEFQAEFPVATRWAIN